MKVAKLNNVIAESKLKQKAGEESNAHAQTLTDGLELSLLFLSL